MSNTLPDQLLPGATEVAFSESKPCSRVLFAMVAAASARPLAR